MSSMRKESEGMISLSVIIVMLLAGFFLAGAVMIVQDKQDAWKERTKDEHQ